MNENEAAEPSWHNAWGTAGDFSVPAARYDESPLPGCYAWSTWDTDEPGGLF